MPLSPRRRRPARKTEGDGENGEPGEHGEPGERGRTKRPDTDERTRAGEPARAEGPTPGGQARTERVRAGSGTEPPLPAPPLRTRLAGLRNAHPVAARHPPVISDGTASRTRRRRACPLHAPTVRRAFLLLACRITQK
ncbi:hypothetical protein GCM10010398_05500 [Streptomyces fimbriatus]